MFVVTFLSWTLILVTCGPFTCAKASFSGLKVFRPKTLASLPEALAKNGNLIRGELSFHPDFLTRFAFHHLEGDMVAVRLNLPSIAFGYRSKQIGLLLPVPAVLKQPLAAAAAGEEGFLMGSAPQSIRKQQTRFAFKIGAEPDTTIKELL